MTAGEDAPQLLGFPRHEARMYAASSSVLARGVLYYGFTRSVSPSQQRLIAQAVRTPGVNRTLVSPSVTQAPHCGWPRWESITRQVAGDASSAIHFWPQWAKERLGYLLLSPSGPPRAHVTAEPLEEESFYPHPAELTEAVVPRTLDEGECDGWRITHHEPLPAFHRSMGWDVARLRRITTEVSALLADQLPAPSGTPPHWVPAHGDFVPWNVRLARDGAVWLIDWEDAMWAPPHTDELRFASGFLSMRGSVTDGLVRELLDGLGRPHEEVGEAAGFLLAHRNTPLSQLDRPADPRKIRSNAEIRLLRLVHIACGGDR
jgi:hypothetical protein